MKNLSDEDIIKMLNNDNTEHVLWSIGLIIIGIFILCSCIFIIINVMKKHHANKEGIQNNEENNLTFSSSLPFIIVLLIIALTLGSMGFIDLKDLIDSSTSFRVEEKYVARADVNTYVNERDKNQLPIITYSIFICEDFSDPASIEKHSVSGSTYDRASQEFTKAYVAVNNNNDTIISIWNENEYQYIGNYLIVNSN